MKLQKIHECKIGFKLKNVLKQFSDNTIWQNPVTSHLYFCVFFQFQLFLAQDETQIRFNKLQNIENVEKLFNQNGLKTICL